MLRASGEVDLTKKMRFERAIESALTKARSPVVIDLTNVRYIDSSGLNSLAQARRRTAASKVFEIVGFDKLFRIYRTLDDAIAAATDAAH